MKTCSHCGHTMIWREGYAGSADMAPENEGYECTHCGAWDMSAPAGSRRRHHQDVGAAIPMCQMLVSITKVGAVWHCLYEDGYSTNVDNEEDAQLLSRVYSVPITDRASKARQWAKATWESLAAAEREKEARCRDQGYEGMADLHKKRAEDLEARAQK